MEKAKRILFSVVLVFSLVFGGFSGSDLVLAQETSPESFPVKMSVNGESATTEYPSLMDAIHAIEELVKSNAANENNTYEIYLDVKQYYIDSNYVMPKAKRISLVGSKSEDSYGGYYSYSGVVLDGEVTFRSDLEMSYVCCMGVNNATLTAKDFFVAYECSLGSSLDPLVSAKFDNFYGFSYETNEKLNSKKYANLDELYDDFDVKQLGLKKIELYCALNADTVTCATNAMFFRGEKVTSHIGTYTYICAEQNIWQQEGILFSTMPSGEEDDYIAVDVKNVLIKYAKTPRMYWYMSTMKQEKSRITVDNISIDSATSTAESMSLEVMMGDYSGGEFAPYQPDCNLDINGQISGIDKITCIYTLMGFEPADGQDWRALMKNQWGEMSFKALTVSQMQENEIEIDAKISFPNGSGGIYTLNIQKKDKEYWIDFAQPLYELFNLDEYVEKDGIYYMVGGGYATPIYYVGDSDTLTIPAYVNIDGVDNCVLRSYHMCAPISLKTNVKTIVLPGDMENVPCLFAPAGSAFNRINAMLEGGNDNSALERFEIAGDNINYSTDDEGNLYNANKSILYCCPPAKSSYIFLETVTKIGDNAFMGSHIETLQVPEQIEIVGYKAFRSMKQLKKVEFQGTNVIDFRGESFAYVGSKGVVLCSNDNDVVKNEALLYGLAYRDSSASEDPGETGGNDQPGESENPEEGTQRPVICLKGDLNEDTNVDLNDAQLALKASLKIISLTKKQTVVCDINGNNQIDLPDAQAILKRALLIIDDLGTVEYMEDTSENGEIDNDDSGNNGVIDDGSWDCQKKGHLYETVKEATFDETGIKRCGYCDKELVLGKKNRNYLLVFIRKEATEYEDGYMITTDEDTGYYKEEVIMHLGYESEQNP